MSQTPVFSITYRFLFPDGSAKAFHAEFDASYALIRKERASYPEWTELAFKQCSHCPLDAEAHRHCPVERNIVDIVEFFQDVQSVEKATVEVETHQRVTKRKQAALYPAISSLMGLHMVTSGCPSLDKLRPMARFHLPFADTEETVYRALSMYALAQYFREQHGKSVDWSFEGLKRIYQEINGLNIDFARRLHHESIGEATTNALTSLDCFAQEIDFSISEEMLEEVEGLFKGYLED